jgi:hypothetical protein
MRCYNLYVVYKNRADLYAAQKRHRIRVRAQLFEYLANKKCIDCGENDPVVLEFDHVDRSKKTKGVARLLSGHWSWNRLLQEIEKCEIRCANCHRRKTYVQLGAWGRSKVSP